MILNQYESSSGGPFHRYVVLSLSPSSHLSQQRYQLQQRRQLQRPLLVHGMRLELRHRVSTNAPRTPVTSRQNPTEWVCTAHTRCTSVAAALPAPTLTRLSLQTLAFKATSRPVAEALWPEKHRALIPSLNGLFTGSPAPTLTKDATC